MIHVGLLAGSVLDGATRWTLKSPLIKWGCRLCRHCLESGSAGLLSDWMVLLIHFFAQVGLQTGLGSHIEP